MMAAEKDSASAPAEALLENPNSRLVIVGQILCILVPLAVWFSPLPLEPVTKHGFAIVGFMVVAWITRAMDYALAGLVGCFLSGRSASSDFRWRSAGSPMTPPGFYSALCCWA
jgi:di/tricarboxylate transporter